MVAEINLRSIFSKVALFLNIWEVLNPKGALDSRSPLAEGSAYSVYPLIPTACQHCGAVHLTSFRPIL